MRGSQARFTRVFDALARRMTLGVFRFNQANVSCGPDEWVDD